MAHTQELLISAPEDVDLVPVERVPPATANGAILTERYNGPVNARQLEVGCYHIKKAPGQ
jgi:hypothetical protein